MPRSSERAYALVVSKRRATLGTRVVLRLDSTLPMMMRRGSAGRRGARHETACAISRIKYAIFRFRHCSDAGTRGHRFNGRGKRLRQLRGRAEGHSGGHMANGKTRNGSNVATLSLLLTVALAAPAWSQV